MTVAALAAGVILAAIPAAADTLAPPPGELFVSSPVPEAPDVAQPPSGAVATESAPAPAPGGESEAAGAAPPAAAAPAAQGDSPFALIVAALSVPDQPTDEEQPFSTLLAAVPEPPPPTPAELLGLVGKDRAKAEKCLANAVYFESRGEPLRGQIAVAQVVLNRVFSPYYPKDVCSVVYQNADRHLACQFTFACDGKSKTIHDRRAWWRAQRVAKLMLDGKVWLAAVAKSTHYHANYVSPAWTAEMRKMYRYGVHMFYRPHRWGDGEKEAGWVRAPLPVLKPKPQPAAAQPKPQTTEKTPAAAPAAVQARADVPIPQPRPPAVAAAAKSEPNGKEAKAASGTRPATANAQARPANAQPKVKPAAPATQGQLKPGQRASLD